MDLGGFLMFFGDFRDSVVDFCSSILRMKNFGGMKISFGNYFQTHVVFCLTTAGNIVRTLRDARACFSERYHF